MRFSPALTALLIAFACNAQKSASMETLPFCGVQIAKAKSIRQLYGEQFAFLQVQEGDTLVDIGAASGWYEGAFSAVMPFRKLHFILVDIDSFCLNAQRVSNMQQYYSAVMGEPISNTFQLVHNTPDSLFLPQNSFSRLWLFNTLHEIPDRVKIVRSIAGVLRTGGEIMVLEILAKKPGELHGGCHKPLFIPDELVSLFQQNGFRFVNQLQVQERRTTVVTMLRFTKTSALL